MGRGVEQNPARAQELVIGAAKAGLAEANNNLGLMWKRGELGIADPTKALIFFETAATQGHVVAAINAAALLSSRALGNADRVRAYAWLNVAVAPGDSTARLRRQELRVKITTAEIAEAQALSVDLFSRE